MNPPRRIASVDVVRALVMALMMIDHVREFFYLHRQVADPVDLHASGLALFFTRAASHICAPAFVLLAGMSAALRQEKRGEDAAATARHLVRRGLGLMLLEVTVVGFAWKFQFPPEVVYLQVIWAIGLSMVALGGLVFLPRGAVLGLSLALIFGQGLLRHVPMPASLVGKIAWSIVDVRAKYQITPTFALRVSYPVLPYVGVIGLGYALGRLYAGGVDPRARRSVLLASGVAAVATFLVLRPLNIYGDPGPFVAGGTPLATLASLLNVTKYPPSPLFLLMTLGPTLILLAAAERFGAAIPAAVSRFGAAPMAYYLLHLLVLNVANRALAWATGTTGLYSFDHVAGVWVATPIFLAIVAP